MFRLDPPPPYRLGRAPLAQALVQVNFPLQARLSRLDGIAPVQEAIDADYPTLHQRHVQPLQFDLAAEGAPQASMGAGVTFYEFESDDDHRLVFMPDQATLSAVGTYGGVSDFLPRFEQLAHVLASVVRIPRISRIGVRYISVAEVPPGDPNAWISWFRPELLGWVGAGLLDEDSELQVAIQQTSILARPSGELSGFPADVQGIVRHGVAPKGSVIPASPEINVQERSYLLDIDLFCEGVILCQADVLHRQFQALHSQIDRFFRWCLSEAGEAHFDLSEGA